MNPADRIEQAYRIARGILAGLVHRNDLEDRVQIVVLQIHRRSHDETIVDWTAFVSLIAIRVRSHWIRDQAKRREREVELGNDDDTYPAPDACDADSEPFPLGELDDFILFGRSRLVLDMLLAGRTEEDIRATLDLTSTQFKRCFRIILREAARLRRLRGGGPA